MFEKSNSNFITSFHKKTYEFSNETEDIAIEYLTESLLINYTFYDFANESVKQYSRQFTNSDFLTDQLTAEIHDQSLLTFYHSQIQKQGSQFYFEGSNMVIPYTVTMGPVHLRKQLKICLKQVSLQETEVLRKIIRKLVKNKDLNTLNEKGKQQQNKPSNSSSSNIEKEAQIFNNSKNPTLSGNQTPLMPDNSKTPIFSNMPSSSKPATFCSNPATFCSNQSPLMPGSSGGPTLSKSHTPSLFGGTQDHPMSGKSNFLKFGGPPLFGRGQSQNLFGQSNQDSAISNIMTPSIFGGGSSSSQLDMGTAQISEGRTLYVSEKHEHVMSSSKRSGNYRVRYFNHRNNYTVSKLKSRADHYLRGGASLTIPSTQETPAENSNCQNQ